ncbi:hypothetical protein KIN20_014174 [Parelaphostrongylus tenuis]|uniref:Uncharacterized protein n=1 Tax=Parelaphostrongylus tenuis TaxID=148309 RepID=A0AAD5MEK1_PARTN|nr:hypothetical protein KIN20_014174 [Parelaphostrongylus tenuis]
MASSMYYDAPCASVEEDLPGFIPFTKKNLWKRRSSVLLRAWNDICTYLLLIFLLSHLVVVAEPTCKFGRLFCDECGTMSRIKEALSCAEYMRLDGANRSETVKNELWLIGNQILSNGASNLSSASICHVYS